MIGHRFRDMLRLPLVVVAAAYVLLEEVLWSRLSRLMAAFGRLPAVARVEGAIRGLPPYPAMILFLLPWAVIVPVKLVALWLIAMGKVLTGAGLFTLGEIIGVAFLARLYALCRPSLHSLAWFVRAEAVVLRWIAWAHGLLDRLAVWRQAKAVIRQWLGRLRHALRGASGRGSADRRSAGLSAQR